MRTDAEITDVADAAQVDGGPAVLCRATDVRRPSERFGALSWAQILADEDKKPAFVKGLLSDGELSIVFGASGSGKSFFCLDLALHIALGWRWNGRKVERRGVIYIAAEGGRSVRRRIRAFAKEHEGDLGSVPFTLIPMAVDLRDAKVDVNDLIAEIRNRATAINVDGMLIVIDTLNRVFAGGNENASEDMGAFVANLDRIRDAIGAHLLVVHHSGKDAAKGVRGHSLLRAAVDVEINVTQDSGTRGTETVVSRRWTVTKSRDGEDGWGGAFRLRPVSLGIDADGDPITSCVVEPIEAADRPVFAKRQSRLSNRDQLTLETLQSLIDGEGARLPHGSDYPSAGHIRGVKLSRFRDETYNRVLNGTGQDSSRKAFNRTKNRLQRFGFIGVRDDWVWLAGQAGQGGTGRDSLKLSRPGQYRDRRDTHL